MAYGKIKADAVIWDNSGTDVEESMSNIAGKLNAAGGAMTGNLTLNAQNELRLADSDSSNYIALESPATVGTNSTWILPSDAPAAGEVLKVTSVSSNNPTLEWGTGAKLLNCWSMPHSTAQSTSSSTFALVTGWEQAITPASANSKFFCMIDIKFGSSSHGSPQYKLQRKIGSGSFTDIAIHTAGALGSSPQVTGGSYTPTANIAQYDHKQYANNFLDSPSTTSEVTYRVVWREGQNGSYTDYINAPGYAIDGSDRGIYVARGHSNFAIFEFAE